MYSYIIGVYIAFGYYEKSGRALRFGHRQKMITRFATRLSGFFHICKKILRSLYIVY